MTSSIADVTVTHLNSCQVNKVAFPVWEKYTLTFCCCVYFSSIFDLYVYLISSAVLMDFLIQLLLHLKIILLQVLSPLSFM